MVIPAGYTLVGMLTRAQRATLYERTQILTKGEWVPQNSTPCGPTGGISHYPVVKQACPTVKVQDTTPGFLTRSPWKQTEGETIHLYQPLAMQCPLIRMYKTTQ